MNRQQRRAEGSKNPAQALNNQAVALAKQGRLEEAVRLYRKAVASAPEFAAAWCNLGDALDGLGQTQAAIAAYRRATALAPAMLNGFYNLGVTLARQGDLNQAELCYRQAVALKPDFAEGHANLSAVLVETGLVEEAEDCARRAVKLAPDYGLAWHNLGLVLHRQRRLVEAEAAYRRALSLQPDDSLFAHNLGTLLLSNGDFAAGWALYESRFELAEMGMSVRRFAQPRWQGEAGDGRKLLIHAEQGLGDTLQFCRYAALAAARGWRVVMEVQPALARLLRGLAGVDELVVQGEALPPFDAQIPMMSLAAVFDSAIPAEVPYLHADPAAVAAWGERVAAIAGPWATVGVVWAGSRRDQPALAAVDARRSMTPELLLPVLDVEGVQFFSLQKDWRFTPPAGVAWADLMNDVTDFADTAALVANLDLVISVDTSVAHLAAAMGKRVWLLNRFDSCWRWLDGRRDSPWYPTLRLYNQPRAGDWVRVVDDAAADLQALASARDDAGGGLAASP
jgi:Flp pilus assembly protein TadD